MRFATGSLLTQPPGDPHPPTPKGGGSGRECVTDSHGTSTGEWEPEHLSIKDELDQRFNAQIEAAREKLAAKAQRRGQFARNRKAGLRLRHANKLRRLNP